VKVDCDSSYLGNSPTNMDLGKGHNGLILNVIDLSSLSTSLGF
jgi:hypothetical protein